MYKTIIIVSLLLSSCTTAPKESQKNNEPQKENTPALTKPVVRRIWIPDQILDGGKVYDQGHWRYLLERDTTWSK